MSVTFTLSCDLPDRCPARHQTVASDVRVARHAARLEGWSNRIEYRGIGKRQVTVDRCPDHPFTSTSIRSAVIDERVPYDRCSYQGHIFEQCGSQESYLDDDGRAVWEWCGHDQLGHRMSRMFLRYGYTSVKAVQEADRRDLSSLRGFGALALSRWDAFTGRVQA